MSERAALHLATERLRAEAHKYALNATLARSKEPIANLPTIQFDANEYARLLEAANIIEAISARLEENE